MKQKQPLEDMFAFTAGHLAEVIDVPRPQVDYAIKHRELPAIKSGRRWIVLRDDALAWLKRCRERGVMPTPMTDRDRQNLAELRRARKAAEASDAP